MTPTRRPPRAFTLIEMLIVLALMTILTASVMPRAEGTLEAQLEAAAHLVAGDIAYARSLATSNNSSYRLRYSTANNAYVLTHIGTNTALDALPSSPYRSLSDPSGQYNVRLADVPELGGSATLYAILSNGSTIQAITDLEFGPLGETVNSAETLIWLKVGAGTGTRYLCVRVHPVTGLTWVEGLRATAPPGTSSQVAAPPGNVGG